MAGYGPNDVVIMGACRTPIGKFKGALSSLKAHHLGSVVIKELLQRSKVHGNQISEVILGEVLAAGEGQNAARQAAVQGGIPYSVPAMTLNMVCGSGMRAIVMAYHSIKSKDSTIVVAGGQESMSQAVHCIYLRKETKYGEVGMKDTLLSDGLTDAFYYYHMGNTAENVAEQWSVTREEQDIFACESQQKCEVAQKNGYFSEEIVPVKIESKKDVKEVTTDEHPRSGVTVQSLECLRPAFRPDSRGTVTAGNSSGLNDGAAALLLMSQKEAAEFTTIEPLGRVVAWAQVGVDPSIMGTGPIPAIRKALEQAGWEIEDVDIFEINEAFASQSVAILKELQIDREKVNVNGGAIALGHPIGSSGARIVVTLLYAMKRLKKRRGVASLCIGGGMGIALCVERLYVGDTKL